MNRQEHLAWCKQNAIRELDNPNVSTTEACASAFASMASDLGKHEATKNHIGISLGMQLLLAGQKEATSKEAMRKFIEGFN